MYNKYLHPKIVELHEDTRFFMDASKAARELCLWEEAQQLLKEALRSQQEKLQLLEKLDRMEKLTQKKLQRTLSNKTP